MHYINSTVIHDRKFDLGSVQRNWIWWKNRKSCIDPRFEACSGVEFCANIQKLSKTLLYSLYLDSLDSVKSTMGFINYWLAMKTRFVSEIWKFWYKVLIKRVFLYLGCDWNYPVQRNENFLRTKSWGLVGFRVYSEKK